MQTICKSIIALLICALHLGSNAEPINATASATGSSSALSFTATVTPTSNFVGNNSKLYLAILLGNAILFYSDTAGFVPFVGGTEPPPVRAITRSTETISFAGDASAAVGADIYIGYGTSFAEMASNARYAKKYTIANGQAPLTVQATSYLNKNELNMPAQTFPTNADIIGSNGQGWMTAGIAFADFWRDGSISMVGAQQVGPATAGRVYFFKSNGNGGWVDKSTELLGPNDRTGCITARKLLVADFNIDGTPDVFMSCTGIDYWPYNGESQRILLSQPNGTYVNKEVPITGYMHGASAADINGDGLPDVLVTDPLVAGKPYFLINNENGNFTPDYTRLPAYVTAGVPGVGKWPIWTVELVDYDDDGKVDVFLAGGGTAKNIYGDVSWKPTFYKNDGTGNFANAQPFVLPLQDTEFETVLDVVVKNGNAYLLNTIGAPGAAYYYGDSVQRVNLQTLQSTVLHKHNGPINGNAHNVNAEWIIPYNGRIVSIEVRDEIDVAQ